MREGKHTFIFLLCHDAPEEMDKRFNYRPHFSIKNLLRGMQARQSPCRVACRLHQFGPLMQSFSFPYMDTRELLKAPQVIS